jgi:hypothetical protein
LCTCECTTYVYVRVCTVHSEMTNLRVVWWISVWRKLKFPMVPSRNKLRLCRVRNHNKKKKKKKTKTNEWLFVPIEELTRAYVYVCIFLFFILVNALPSRAFTYHHKPSVVQAWTLLTNWGFRKRSKKLFK